MTVNIFYDTLASMYKEGNMLSEKNKRGKHFAKIVRWKDSKGLHTGIVEGQSSGLLRIFVFNKEKFGNRRTTRKVGDIQFC